MATLAVMAAAFALAYIAGMAAGYWGRRGRPGFIAATLQRWGTRHFSRWYIENLEYATSQPMYAVARARIHREIMADPGAALDPEALQALERCFEERRVTVAPNAPRGPGMVSSPTSLTGE